MEINEKVLNKLRTELGDGFYLLDSEEFKQNFMQLKESFSKHYENFNIAYSYKTNYIPKLCKLVNELGGYAEIVSEMELEIAYKCGVSSNRIIWNGPVKNTEIMYKFLLDGGNVNVDSYDEATSIVQFAKQNDKKINVGIRCNFDVEDGVISRFGVDACSEEFGEIVSMLQNEPNINLNSFQCHFAKRNVEYWPNRVKGMLKIIDEYGTVPDRIDLGGGLFGKMPDMLKVQFTAVIPEYDDYAEVAAKIVAEHFENKTKKPELIIEPGSALVGNCMKFVASIMGIKCVRGKHFATVMGSQKNISMTGVTPPIELISFGNGDFYENIDIVGYTCIENDVIAKNYSGKISVGDMIVVSNCGSYSVVMKPPFILPNFPVADISGGKTEIIKKKETFNDVFATYFFNDEKVIEGAVD